MFKWLMHRGVGLFERQWDYDAGYVHEMIEASPRAAWMFSRAAAIGRYRKDVPAAAWAAAAITAVRHEDCGPCTQLAGSRWPSGWRRAESAAGRADGDPAAMPPDVALAWRFTRATLDHDPSADQYRDEIIRRWGPRAVVSLAFAMVTRRECIRPSGTPWATARPARASSSAARSHSQVGSITARPVAHGVQRG